jgi:hypothetical protein
MSGDAPQGRLMAPAHGTTAQPMTGMEISRMTRKPVLGPDGKQLVRAGKPAWDVIVSFANATTKTRFSDAVIAAVERDYPGVFGVAPHHER